jgi:hypothetical protein
MLPEEDDDRDVEQQLPCAIILNNLVLNGQSYFELYKVIMKMNLDFSQCSKNL